VGVGLLVVLALVLWLLKWWSRRRLLASQEPPVPAHVRARQHLDAALRLISQPREFSFAVSDALRGYLEERFRLRAPERTTEEFLRELEVTGALLPDQKQALAGFLEQSDLVKFARYEPNEDALRELHAAALRLVDETALTMSLETATPPVVPPGTVPAIPPAPAPAASSPAETNVPPPSTP
jgi:hypothetical protein